MSIDQLVFALLGPVADTKRCPRCKQEKVRATDFHPRHDRPGSVRSRCKACEAEVEQLRPSRDVRSYNRERYVQNADAVRARSKRWYEANREQARDRQVTRRQIIRGQSWERNLRDKYGITKIDYERMLAIQGGVCAICKCTQNTGGRSAQLFVDHNHATGEVRGLLCNKCNFAIGQFNDDPGRCRTAAIYLEGNRSR